MIKSFLDAADFQIRAVFGVSIRHATAVIVTSPNPRPERYPSIIATLDPRSRLAVQGVHHGAFLGVTHVTIFADFPVIPLYAVEADESEVVTAQLVNLETLPLYAVVSVAEKRRPFGNQAANRFAVVERHGSVRAVFGHEGEDFTMGVLGGGVGIGALVNVHHGYDLQTVFLVPLGNDISIPQNGAKVKRVYKILTKKFSFTRNIYYVIIIIAVPRLVVIPP